LKKVTVMRAEVVLVAGFVLLGMGAWLGVDRAATRMLKSREPSEEAEQLSREVQWKRDALSMTEKEREATETQLIQARLDYYKQSSALAALPEPTPTPSPALTAKPSPTSAAAKSAAVKDAGAQSAAAEAARKREEALAQLKASGAYVNGLIARLELLQQKINELKREVDERTRAASAEYNYQRIRYRIIKAALTLGGTLLLLFVVYLILSSFFRAYTKSARESGHEPNTRFVLTAAIGLFIVLVAYQTFELAGAAFVGVLVLLYFLKHMSWEKVKADGDGAE
jgi:hypothetical protein